MRDTILLIDSKQMDQCAKWRKRHLTGYVHYQKATQALSNDIAILVHDLKAQKAEEVQIADMLRNAIFATQQRHVLDILYNKVFGRPCISSIEELANALIFYRPRHCTL